MGDNAFVNNAPKPMAQFSSAYYTISPHNQKLLDDEKARQARILDKRALKKAQQKLVGVQAKLDIQQVDNMLAELQNLVEEKEQLRLQFLKTKERIQANPDNPKPHADMAIIMANRQQLIEDMRLVRQRIRPYRRWIVRRDALRSRIDEHINIELDMKQAEKDKKDMAKEAELFAQTIIRSLSGLGFVHERRRNGKVYEDKVRFEKIIVTPDDIQFKVDVSQIGLMDGVIRNLPSGVRAHQLVEDDVLHHLSVACERDVVSPNTDGRCSWSKGVWYQLYRTNYRDGLMEYVTYEQVMQRYPVDIHDKFPLPAGVKAGRYINWINLVDHPHWLFAGQTGSGKTNLMRAFMSSLISTHSPDEIRFVVIDLKRNGDFNPYEKTPHVLGNIIKTVEDTVTIVQQLESLMYERMERISRVTNKIEDYNQIVEPENRMPRIIIVFDEYGAIQAKSKDLAVQIEASMKLIATQSRAAGIHGWFGIQQSYSDSINKLIKGNITIAFSGRQRTLGGSMSVGSNGSAMKLAKIPGRMLCDDGTDSYQIQAPFLSKQAMHKSIANTAKWDTPRPLELPSLVTIEEEAETIEPFDENMLIEIALTQFDGLLSARGIWESLDRHDVSHGKVTKIAKKIKQKQQIEYKGTIYDVVPERKSFRLIKHKNTDTGDDDTPLLPQGV